MAVYSALFGVTPAEHVAYVQNLLCSVFTFLQHVPSMLPDRELVGSGIIKILGLTPATRANFDPGALHVPYEIYADLVQINILWGILNLLPIWPLDGGQVTVTVLSEINPYNGRRWAHIVSLLTAAACAIVIYSQYQSLWNTLFFIYFAVINYQMLESIHRAQSLGTYGEDWWRR
jgi:membrane-associated protease RseP (regulator of RpoE activity)